MKDTDFSPTGRPLWPILAAVAAGLCIAGTGLVFEQWTIAGLICGGAVMALGAISGVMGGYLVLFPRVRVFALVWLGFLVTSVALPAWLMLV